MNYFHQIGSSLRGLVTSRGLLIALFGFVLFVRAGWMVNQATELDKDTDLYLEVAGNLAREGIFAVGAGDLSPTASRPPLYPVLLSFVADSEGSIPKVRVGLVNFGLGFLTILFTWLFVRRAVPKSPGAAMISALLVACDPLLMAFSAQAMTETPAACLVALTCWLFAVALDSEKRWTALALGFSIGLATLSRASFLPLVPLAALALGCLKVGAQGTLVQRFRPALWVAALCLMGATAAMTPWIVRNYGVFGKFIPATNHGGYALAVANSPDYLHYVRHEGRGSGPWSLLTFDETISNDYPRLSYYRPGIVPPNILPQQELEMDRFLYQLAFEWITADLEAFGYLTADRFLQFWNPLPHPSTLTESKGQKMVRLGVGSWYIGILGMMLLSTLLSGRKIFQAPLVWPLLICVVISGIHLFFWSNMRMRAPVMPCVCVFASLGILSVWSFVTARLGKGIGQSRIVVADGLHCGDI